MLFVSCGVPVLLFYKLDVQAYNTSRVPYNYPPSNVTYVSITTQRPVLIFDARSLCVPYSIRSPLYRFDFLHEFISCSLIKGRCSVREPISYYDEDIRERFIPYSSGWQPAENELICSDLLGLCFSSTEIYGIQVLVDQNGIYFWIKWSEKLIKYYFKSR